MNLNFDICYQTSFSFSLPSHTHWTSGLRDYRATWVCVCVGRGVVTETQGNMGMCVEVRHRATWVRVWEWRGVVTETQSNMDMCVGGEGCGH